MRMFAQDRAFYRGIRVDGTEPPEALRRLELLGQVALARRLEGAGSAKQPPADASREALNARGCVAGVRHSRGDALVRQGASALGAQPPASRPAPEPGRGGAHRAVGPRVRAHQALLVLVRGPRQGQAQARLLGRPRRALAQGGQAQGHPDGPHDPDRRRQDAQGVPGRLPQDPPRRPELNGIVERANRTSKMEFWRFHDGELSCEAVNEALAEHLDYYNNRRPHRALGMKTPAEMAGILGMAA